MIIKRYKIRCIAEDLLEVTSPRSPHWVTAASSMQSAWDKFVRQERAHVFRFGTDHQPLAQDYDVSLIH